MTNLPLLTKEEIDDIEKSIYTHWLSTEQYKRLIATARAGSKQNEELERLADARIWDQPVACDDCFRLMEEKRELKQQLAAKDTQIEAARNQLIAHNDEKDLPLSTLIDLRITSEKDHILELDDLAQKLIDTEDKLAAKDAEIAALLASNDEHVKCTDWRTNSQTKAIFEELVRERDSAREAQQRAEADNAVLWKRCRLKIADIMIGWETVRDGVDDAETKKMITLSCPDCGAESPNSSEIKHKPDCFYLSSHPGSALLAELEKLRAENVRLRSFFGEFNSYIEHLLTAERSCQCDLSVGIVCGDCVMNAMLCGLRQLNQTLAAGREDGK